LRQKQIAVEYRDEHEGVACMGSEECSELIQWYKDSKKIAA
jgi:hypothetical protein